MSENIFAVLAPMAGVTDLCFRQICREMGADLTVTEMISAKAVTQGNKKTYELCRIFEAEHPAALQLFGSEPETMAEAVRILDERIPYEILDINMGCPMAKIVNNGEGSALMRDPVLAGRIVEAVAGATDKRVTVKMRSGFDQMHLNAPEVAHAVCESGAQGLTVHGRTREQYYEGKADWNIIAEVKSTVNVPVIGNGDVCGIADAQRMIGETGCDGVAIGRAARGNPWIFRELKAGKVYIPTADEKKEMMLRHLDMTVGEKGEYIGIREMRKHIGWYTSGLEGSAKLRVRINRAETASEMRALIAGI